MDSKSIPKIVLTGGPGGGKTTFLAELRARDPRIQRYILVPEAATLLIQAGHRPGSKEFQLAVVEIQIALESGCALPAKPGQILVCDRSTVDSLAYWLLLGGVEEEFYDRTGLDRENHLNQYSGVIHLRTAALGAPRHYLRLGDGARVETTEEAAEVDALCATVWERHPRYSIVENNGKGWIEKSREVLQRLESILDALPPIH